jgi:hypothetical protein
MKKLTKETVTIGMPVKFQHGKETICGEVAYISPRPDRDTVEVKVGGGTFWMTRIGKLQPCKEAN